MKRMFALLLIVALLSGFAFAEGASGWICVNCGTENAGNFCVECGAARPEEIVCPSCGTRYPVDTTSRFCTECGAKLAQDEDEPSKAILEEAKQVVYRYLDGLRARDLDAMLSAFDWEALEEHRTLGVMLEANHYYDPSSSVPAFPRDGALLSYINIEAMRHQAAQTIRLCVLKFLATGPLEKGSLTDIAIGLAPAQIEDVGDFLAQFDTARLDTLSQIDGIAFALPEEAFGDAILSSNVQERLEQTRAQYGADEILDLYVTFTIGDAQFGLAPGLVRYGDEWTFYALQSVSAVAIGIPTTSAAFAEVG